MANPIRADLHHNPCRIPGLSLSFNLISIHIRLYIAHSLIYLIAVVGTAVSLILGKRRLPLQGSYKTAPGWEYQFTAAIGHLRTVWAALLDVARTTPATRTATTIAQVKNVLRRLRAAGHGQQAAPPFIFDAGDSAAALADGLAGCPAHVLVRLAAGSVFYAEPVAWEGKYGRPARRGALPGTRGLRRCRRRQQPAGPEEAPAPEPRARPDPYPARYPALRHRPRRGLARPAPPHPRRPQLVRRQEETAGPARHPRPRHRRAPPRRTRPAPRYVAVARRPRPLVPRRALARLPRQVRYRARLQALQGHPRAHRREDPCSRAGRPAGPGSSWPRTPSSSWPAPWPPTSAVPGRNTPTPPGGWHRAGSAAGFATSAATWGLPPVSRNPPAPGPEGPKEAAKDPRPATFSPAKPTCQAPRTRC